MQALFLVAAVIAILVGIVHSILGEVLIFHRLRRRQLTPTTPAPPLQSRHIRILWATWHLASIFGFAFAGLLYALAGAGVVTQSALIKATVFAFTAGAALVLFATRGRHPGWVGLLAVAVLSYIATIT